MADKIVLGDTSILIEFFRKKDKSKTTLVRLLEDFDRYCISAITEFEIFSGANESQKEYWEAFLEQIIILPFDSSAVERACEID
jgi:tRNA(fMet)-specific endonuclease VapC